MTNGFGPDEQFFKIINNKMDPLKHHIFVCIRNTFLHEFLHSIWGCVLYTKLEI